MDTPQLNKAILIPSTNSGGSFNNRNKLITFSIDNDGSCYDFSQSFLQLVLTATVNDNTIPDGVINVGLSNVSPNDTLSINNLDFIRNATLISSRVGVLEQQLRSNVLHGNLNVFSKTIAQMESQIDSLYQTFDYHNLNKSSPFVDMYREGNVSSRYVDPHIRIKLSDLLEMGAMTQYNTLDFNTTTMTFELEDLTRFAMTFNQVINPALEPYTIGLTVEDVSGVVPVSNVLIYQSTEEQRLQTPLPLFVGQSIRIKATRTDLAEPPNTSTVILNTYITSINFKADSDPQVYEITCNDALPALDPVVYETTYSPVEIFEYVPDEPTTFEITIANLGLVKVPTPKPADKIMYDTYEIEEYTFNDLQYFQHIFYLPPTCSNVWVMFNNPNTKNLLSHAPQIESYRFTIDNVQVLNRDCRVNIDNNDEDYLMMDSLHYLLLKNTFINSSTPLNNLVGLNNTSNYPSSLVSREQGFSKNQVLVLGTPCNMTEGLKNFLVNINCKDTETINSLTLFKQVMKTIMFK